MSDEKNADNNIKDVKSEADIEKKINYNVENISFLNQSERLTR